MSSGVLDFSDVRDGALPAAPPAAALAGCEHAARLMQELADRGGWVEFVSHPRTGHVHALVVAPDGGIGPALSPADTLELIGE